MLTKSNFIKFLECSCQLWLVKNMPHLLPPIDAALQRLFDEGNKVDLFAKKLFPRGVEIAGFNEAGARNTAAAIAKGATVLFQPTFTGNGITCRCDILVKRGRSWDLYEVKSSTGQKGTHVMDLAFQRICLEESGIRVGKTFLVHVNNQYVRRGKVDPFGVLTTVNLTQEVKAALPVARTQVARAKKTLALSTKAGLDLLKACSAPGSCPYLPLYAGTILHEDAYAIAPGLPRARLRELLARGVIAPKDVPPDLLESLGGAAAFRRSRAKKPVVSIDREGLAREFAELEYPLHFLDYETFASAIPDFDGYRPYQQAVFQYSLHVLRKPVGRLEHKEFLHDASTDPAKPVAAALARDIGPVGSVIVWNERFEASRNEELARLVPSLRAPLRSINERMYDLMQVVKRGLYLDSRFEGSASLKKVLPVVVPSLSYGSLNVRNGEMAAAGWPELTHPRTSAKRKKALRRDLLAYCRLDTLAMVEIFKKFSEASKA
ncbi:hypothetical protein A2856_02975 [Candidatus Uhrbacteria bacterium RIFCSPHIGHO2_01_FULL_63_20]|uniref:DUF2779 domain-containing protein n=1 Tax=Candidatus Uhrbacteria bacterium RIFCSPHIGHO2_01_FULL_63_20 TaxID=1802385 RepID=A0A1F7TL65_9BACT|nr:MAG: hypothetical protein A2856_02975 [Candidatus Uhrbacteria bacterium RIFCSPHIGHO2_01_FULL_63_20]